MSEEIKNGNKHNIDSMLVETFNEQAPSFIDRGEQQLTDDAPQAESTQESAPESNNSTINNESTQDVTPEPEVDEFGSEIKKPEKMYTQAEVESMMRKRWKDEQERKVDAPPQYQTTQSSDDQPESDWQEQLEGFMNKAWDKREQRQSEERWRQQQQEVQAQFEIRFNEGASRYADFQEVVHGKPITPEMALATRGMSDPAAFIYAASKTQAKELERISQIRDPMSQAYEIGQLAEKMRKARSSVSQAPRPIEQPAGDVADKSERIRSIDDKIQMDEKRIRQERMRR